jgi:hypothetical protein
MLLQLDPLDHHFDPEGQAPTLWASTSWSTGSEGWKRLLVIPKRWLLVPFGRPSTRRTRPNWWLSRG